MTIYAVLVPRDDAQQAASGAVFVPDHFSRAAFVFGPLWLLRHRVWRGLIGYATVLVLIVWATRWLHLPPLALILITSMLALYLGFEGQMLRRAALERRGFQLADVVAAHDYQHAEQSFFESVADPVIAPAASRPGVAAAPFARALPEVLGSFPEPGGLR